MLQEPSKDGIQRAALCEGLSGLNGPLGIVLEPSYTPSVNPMMVCTLVSALLFLTLVGVVI